MNKKRQEKIEKKIEQGGAIERTKEDDEFKSK